MYRLLTIIIIMLLTCGGSNNAATRKKVAVRKKVKTSNIQKSKSATNKVVTTEDSSTEGFYVHEVVQGETLPEIAKTYDVTKKDLISWNQLRSNEIKPGDKLKVLFDNDNTSFYSYPGEEEKENQYDDISDYEINEENILGAYNFTMIIDESKTEISGTLILYENHTATRQGILRNALMTDKNNIYATYYFIAKDISWSLEDDYLIEDLGNIHLSLLSYDADKEDDIVKYYKKHPDEFIESRRERKKTILQKLLTKHKVVEINPSEMVLKTNWGSNIIYNRKNASNTH